MSNTYHIHGARYLRKYTAAERTACYAYMSDVRKIANSLCKVPWTKVGGDIDATSSFHSEESLDWNVAERDRFDAAEWCAEHENGMHRAYAQAACYVFKLPDGAVGKTIEKIRVNVTSDPYNPYGARISALTSTTLAIPTDCATVRTGDVYRAPDEDGMGAAPRLYVEGDDGAQTWYSNSETVDLEPTSLAAKKYLFIFVCLENYNRGRDGWIEGSSYIENNVELTLASAVPEWNDNGEIEDLSAVGEWEIRQYGGLEANYTVKGTIPARRLRQPVHPFASPFLAVLFGEPSETDLGVIPGLTILATTPRALSGVDFGSVFAGSGTCPVSVDPDTITYLNAFLVSSNDVKSLVLVYVTRDGYVCKIDGMPASDGVVDLSGAQMTVLLQLRPDLEVFHMTTTRIVGKLASGDLYSLAIDISDGSVSGQTLLAVGGGIVTSVAISKILPVVVFGTFTSLGASSISHCAALSLDFTAIESPFESDFEMDSYAVSQMAETGMSGPSGNVYTASGGVSAKRPIVLYGDFTTINGKKVDGFAAILHNEKVLPLKREKFICIPTAVVGPVGYSGDKDWADLSGVGIVDIG